MKWRGNLPRPPGRGPALAAVIALGVLACAPGLQAADGLFIYSIGAVRVHRAGGTLDAEPGLEVGGGDVVETGRDGTAVLELAGSVQLKLRENTRLALDSLEGTDIAVRLARGSLFSRVTGRLAGRYSVRTDAAVAGVRGTEFFVAYGRRIDRLPDVWLCVKEGSVEVSVPQTTQTVIVRQGEGINIVGGLKLTRPRRYAWTRRLNWNTDPAKGEVMDRTNLDQAYSDLLDQDYR
jgi:ferric-dicitrate binding protein FerR (iron transport regulator)